MERLQLLSPAGDAESVIAAVSNGADAIYLGSKLFNARRLAGNFTPEELKRVIQYAHFNKVKIFLTLNTLIKNREIVPFLNQVSLAQQLGVDAIIMQDLTFAPLIKRFFPTMSIHASTQATIMNSPAVEFWKKYVDVFVLARELSKDEIKALVKKTKAHAEVFVHGHLCISYSGQCLISSLIGKRSGNRGLCASSCRKQYNGNDYLLSAKDLCLIRNIPDVIESGAKTIKIEGRMKPAEYVATTTRYYRQQIDSHYQQRKIPITEKTIRDLKLVFNREFTPGFFNNECSIVDPAIPSKRGVFLGTVRSGQLLLQDTIQVHDGINVVYKGEKNGCFVKSILIDGREVEKAHHGQKVTLRVPNFKNGAMVYLMTPLQGENLVGLRKTIPVTFSMQVQRGKVPRITLRTVHNTTNKAITQELKTPASQPEKYPLTSLDINKEIRKWCSPFFHIESVDVKTDDSFFPKSELTALRKQWELVLLDTLHPVTAEKIVISPPSLELHPATEKKLHVRVYSIAGVQEALHAGADAIYYDIFTPGIEDAAKLIRNAQHHGSSVQFYVHTPMVLTDMQISELKARIEQIKPDGIMVNNVGLLSLNLPCPLVLGYQMNIFNDQQLQYYSHPAIASIELSLEELSQFKNKRDLILYAHGRPVVMTFKERFNADYLRDKEKYTFPLRRSGTSTEMLYSKPIGALQHVPDVLKAGITQLYLDLQENVGTITRVYRHLLDGKHTNTRKLQQEVTRGNLYKGVM